MGVTRVRKWEDVEKESLELSSLTRHVELHNKTEGKSPKTVVWYAMVLRQFHRFLQEAEMPTRLGELDEMTVREFILYLHQKRKWADNPYHPATNANLSGISIQSYVRALRVFFNWLNKEGYTTENRLAKLKPPKAPIKLLEILTQEEIARILGCIDTNTAAGARDKAGLIFLLDTGLRSSELFDE